MLKYACACVHGNAVCAGLRSEENVSAHGGSWPDLVIKIVLNHSVNENKQKRSEKEINLLFFTPDYITL